MKAGLVPLQHFCGGVGLGFTICSASSIILAEHSVVQMALHMAAEALTGQKRLIAHSRHAPHAILSQGPQSSCLSPLLSSGEISLAMSFLPSTCPAVVTFPWPHKRELGSVLGIPTSLEKKGNKSRTYKHCSGMGRVP